MIWSKISYDTYVYVDEKGRIVGEYIDSHFDDTTIAIYEGQNIGRYMTTAFAKAAIEEAYLNRILK